MKQVARRSLKMKAACSSKMSVDVNRLLGVVSQRQKPFITTAVRAAFFIPGLLHSIDAVVSFCAQTLKYKY
jgi:hypothetical protein